MAMVNADGLKMEFGQTLIFDSVSFDIYEQDKVGLIGVNGAGKTTLFKVLSKEYEATDGSLIIGKNTVIGYMEQHACHNSERTVFDEILTVFSDLIDLEIELNKTNFDIENRIGDIDSLVKKQQSLHDKFQNGGGLTYLSRASAALIGLGFSKEDFDKPVSFLSGGQRSKLSLGKLLLSGANLLLLDEPTNHLDIDSVEWLEDFLINFKGAFVVISHDRYFLDRVTSKTFELENKHFRSYDGNYSEYMIQREIDKLTTERNYDYTMREIHRLEGVLEQQRRWKHKKNKKTHTMDNTRKAIERLEKSVVAPEKSPESMRFKYKACPGGAQRVLETWDLGMAFGENKLFEHVDMLIKKGEKVFLLGPNGCGKTTLIKIFMGVYAQTQGEFKIGDNIHVGYYDQLKENLHGEKTVIDEVWDEYPSLTQTEIRNALAVFLFKGEDVFKEIRSLSGGELARVELTKLLLKSVNFLILDEPTNHLDIASREALESALTDYDGTLLVVSHDRYLINKLATRIFRISQSGMQVFDGNYEYYVEHFKEPEKEKNVKEKPKVNDYKLKKQRESDIRRKKGEIDRCEKKIAETDEAINLTQETLNDPEITSSYTKIAEITAKLDELHEEQEKLMEEWEKLQEELEEMVEE